MSLFNSLQIAVTGVSAQANQLGVIGTNVANIATTGYKAPSVLFETLMGPEGKENYKVGGVQSQMRFDNKVQGNLGFTNSTTDLAVDGKGFFVVKGTDGTNVMTRSGSFTPDVNRNLVNAQGFTLMGYNATTGGLEPVNIPDGLANVKIGNDGTVSATDSTGTAGYTLYKIPLANVRSPDNLTHMSNNVYQASATSGEMTVGTADSGSLGTIRSGALEASTTDLATELTRMITTQRAYEANSKVITVSSDMITKLNQAAV